MTGPPLVCAYCIGHHVFYLPDCSKLLRAQQPNMLCLRLADLSRKAKKYCRGAGAHAWRGAQEARGHPEQDSLIHKRVSHPACEHVELGCSRLHLQAASGAACLELLKLLLSHWGWMVEWSLFDSMNFPTLCRAPTLWSVMNLHILLR